MSDEDYFSEQRSWSDIEASCGMSNRDLIKLKANRSFRFFLKHILGANTESPLIQELIGLVEDPPEQNGKATKVAIEAARGHSKTFTATIARTLWTAYRGHVDSADGTTRRSPEVLVVSASQRQSTDIVKKMKRILLRNDALDHLPAKTDVMDEAGGDYAIDDSEKEWAAESFTTTTDVRVRCKPFRSGIRGKHVDMLLMDDILSPDGSRTIEREKDIFYSDFSPIVENKGGLLQVVGTPRAHNGLLEELMNKESYYTAEYPAIIDNEPMWPYLWTKQSLAEKKAEIGPARFAREYLCQPVSKGERYFPYDKAIGPNLDTEHNHWKCDASQTRYDDWQFYAGSDIAMEDSANSDFMVIQVIGVDPDGQSWLVDQIRHKGLGPDEIRGELENADRRYTLQRIFVEKNAIGIGALRAIKKSDQIGGRVEPFKTTRKNRTEILSDLQAALFRNDITIPNNDVLIDELLGFKMRNGKLQGKDHDDTVMALAIAWQAVDNHGTGEVSAAILNDEGEVTESSYGPNEDNEDFAAVIV